MTKNVEIEKKSLSVQSKVIHIEKNDFIAKIVLYTKLCTLSTEHPTNFVVYIVK